MMQLNDTYNRDDFLKFLEENFLTDFKKDVRPASTQGLSSIQNAYSLGRSERLDLQVFEFSFEGSPNKRVTLTKDAFQVMRSSAIFRALAIFHSPGSDDWRLSLMTATPVRTEKGKVALSYSNPKRLSFFLGPNAKVNTPTKFILKRERIINFEDLKSRFSVEVVNKEFYKEISELFTQLVGGSVHKGKHKEDYEALLKLPDIQDKSQTSLEFAVRLIGRVIFCWFLREKKSNQSKSLMPHELLSLEAVKNNSDYYHKVLEPIFFEVLNKPGKSRKDDFAKEPFSSVPYLNGGLFSPHDDDFFSYNEGRQTTNHNMVVIPDEWIRRFFDVLETYNFTIDENTSFDEELSIDPEMLGRIFENLLAEINPETGESARKSTGSYYTPRVIVDYMVDESLLLYLKNQTQIDEGKLRAVVSYDLHDDEENLLTQGERERIITALEKVKILDPACGSGAFPIGALQKIVFILQQADPVGQLWFKKQIKNTSPEIRRVIEREFAHKNFDYIRKLGIIRENIYGVDIQPIATEISRLRCFLTLVVDERVQEDLENRGIEPLPNLDFKFVTANTLVGLPGSQVSSQIGLFEDDAGIRELKELRDMFFNASGAERNQLKLQFVQAQNRMFQRMIEEGRRGYADLTSKLSSWDPFSHKASVWFDPGWMFGIDDGFDIVIANPPYGIIFDIRLKELYEDSFSSFKRNNDIYIAFYERGLQLTSDTGYLTYISPNTFLNGDYFKKIRELILRRTRIISVIDYKELSIFADPTVFVCVFVCERHDSPNLPYSYIHRVINSSINQYKEYNVKIRDAYDVRFKPHNAIWEKINSQKNVDIIDHLFYVKDIGFNYWTEGKGKKRDGNSIGDRILYSGIQQHSKDVPFLKGRDIDKYRYAQPSNYLRHDFNSYLGSNDVFRYSQNFLEITPKIIYRQTSNRIVATIDFDSLYLDKTVHLIVPKNSSNLLDLKYLLALLNSSLFNYLYSYVSQEGEGRTFSQVKTTYIKQLPIKINPASDQAKFINIVNLILDITKAVNYIEDPNKQSQVEKYQRQINEMVHKLYGLTEEEIKTVEEQTSVSVATEPILESTTPTELNEQLTISQKVN